MRLDPKPDYAPPAGFFWVRCACCKEWMSCATKYPKKGEDDECLGCQKDIHPGAGTGAESGEGADRQYHGDLWYRGEW